MSKLPDLLRIPVGFMVGLVAGMIVKSAFTQGLAFAAIAAVICAMIWGGMMLFHRIDRRVSGWIFGPDPVQINPEDKPPRAYFWVPAALGAIAGLILTTEQISRFL
ncbi:MAG: hypothetical protein AAFP28_06030 [Pseudomonadota bacterium]